jgi:hypothetical protein
MRPVQESVESQPRRYRSVTAGLTRSEPYKASDLITLEGDDGVLAQDIGKASLKT